MLTSGVPVDAGLIPHSIQYHDSNRTEEKAVGCTRDTATNRQEKSVINRRTSGTRKTTQRKSQKTIRNRYANASGTAERSSFATADKTNGSRTNTYSQIRTYKQEAAKRANDTASRQQGNRLTTTTTSTEPQSRTLSRLVFGKGCPRPEARSTLTTPIQIIETWRWLTMVSAVIVLSVN